jgi:hypothetical protein
VTASAHRKLKRGVLETHAKRSIHHRAVKRAVGSLKAKVAYCISLIEDYGIVENFKDGQSMEFRGVSWLSVGSSTIQTQNCVTAFRSVQSLNNIKLVIVNQSVKLIVGRLVTYSEAETKRNSYK